MPCGKSEQKEAPRTPPLVEGHLSWNEMGVARTNHGGFCRVEGGEKVPPDGRHQQQKRKEDLFEGMIQEKNLSSLESKTERPTGTEGKA